MKQYCLKIIKSSFEMKKMQSIRIVKHSQSIDLRHLYKSTVFSSNDELTYIFVIKAFKLYSDVVIKYIFTLIKKELSY